MLKVNQSDASQGYCCHHGCTVDAVGQDYDCFGGHDMKNNRCRDYEFGEACRDPSVKHMIKLFCDLTCPLPNAYE